MPNWATRITTIGQVVLVAIAVTAVTVLALNHIIDGAAALTTIIIILGAGGAVTAATHTVAGDSGKNDGNPNPKV